MGLYINPPTSTKEHFLAAYGEQVALEQYLAADGVNVIPVCLMNNGSFTAAGVGYSKREAADFSRPDGRPKTYWLVPISALTAVSKSGISMVEFNGWRKVR